MSRTMIDRERQRTTGRLSAYARLDRVLGGEAGHPIVKSLTRRSNRDGADSARIRHYLRIERGHRA